MQIVCVVVVVFFACVQERESVYVLMTHRVTVVTLNVAIVSRRWERFFCDDPNLRC